MFLEQAVEIAQVVEAAGKAYLRHAVGRIDEPTAGIAQAHIDDVVAEVAPRVQLEEAAEGRRTHAGDVGQRAEAYLVHVVLGNIVLHLQHAPRVALRLHLGIAVGGQHVNMLALGELVEDGQELHDGIEAVLDAAQRVDERIDTHDVVHRETDATAGLQQHLSKGQEGCLGQVAVVAQVEKELDGHLADVVVAAGVLLPDVLQLGTGDEHQVVVAYHLAAVAHRAEHTGGMLDKV